MIQKPNRVILLALALDSQEKGSDIPSSWSCLQKWPLKQCVYGKLLYCVYVIFLYNKYYYSQLSNGLFSKAIVV